MKIYIRHNTLTLVAHDVRTQDERKFIFANGNLAQSLRMKAGVSF
jgi:hypothetical protein